jgi:hypothetical protein
MPTIQILTAPSCPHLVGIVFMGGNDNNKHNVLRSKDHQDQATQQDVCDGFSRLMICGINREVSNVFINKITGRYLRKNDKTLSFPMTQYAIASSIYSLKKFHY